LGLSLEAVAISDAKPFGEILSAPLFHLLCSSLTTLRERHTNVLKKQVEQSTKQVFSAVLELVAAYRKKGEKEKVPAVMTGGDLFVFDITLVILYN
jgi:hypothetical protein